MRFVSLLSPWRSWLVRPRRRRRKRRREGSRPRRRRRRRRSPGAGDLVCPSELGRGRQDPAPLLRRPQRTSGPGGRAGDHPAAPRAGNAVLRAPQPSHLFGRSRSRPKQAYRNYTATIGVLTMDNTLVGRADHRLRVPLRNATCTTVSPAAPVRVGSRRSLRPGASSCSSRSGPTSPRSASWARSCRCTPRRHRSVHLGRPARGDDQQPHGRVPTCAGAPAKKAPAPPAKKKR